MNKEKQIVPEVRFPEFIGNDDWKEYQLKEFLELLTDFEANGSFADVKKNVTILNEPDYAWYVRATDLEKQSALNDVKYVNKHSYDFLKKTKLFGGELLITKRGEIGKVYLYESIDSIKATVAPNMYLLKMLNNALPKFFYYYFINHQGNESLKKLNASSTIGALYKNDVKNLSVYVPLLNEQQKIANCLSSLDNVITTETEKLENLKDHKKGLLQQLFPVNGETKPQFRFPEFKNDGDWVETTLDDVADYENGKAHEKEISATGKYKVVNSKFISTEGRVVKYTDSANLKANVGDVLMVLSDIPNGKAIAKCFYVDKEDTYTVNQRICKITPTDIDNKFLFYIQNRNSYFLAFDDGVKQTNLRKDTVLSFPFLKPSNPKEQQKIANCLSSADDLIEAQKIKIKALKNHKKGLMQQLFTNSL
jgi:type I restriction enzyme S subunit